MGNVGIFHNQARVFKHKSLSRVLHTVLSGILRYRSVAELWAKAVRGRACLDSDWSAQQFGSAHGKGENIRYALTSLRWWKMAINRERKGGLCGTIQHFIAVGLYSLMGKALRLSWVNCFSVRLHQVPQQEKFPLPTSDRKPRTKVDWAGSSIPSHSTWIWASCSPTLHHRLWQKWGGRREGTAGTPGMSPALSPETWGTN